MTKQGMTGAAGGDRAKRGPRGPLGFLVLAAVLMAALYAALIFARVWRADFRSPSDVHAALSLLGFYIDTFALQGGVGLAALAVLLAWRRRWWLCAAAIPGVLFTVGPALASYLPRSPAAISGKRLKVMSVNLLASNPHTAGVVSEIAAADPDLLLIQEYNRRWDEAIRPAVGQRYPHVLTLPRGDCFGLALFSRLPIEKAINADLRLGGVNLPAMRAVLRFEDRPLVVYNLHLVPPMGASQHAVQSRQVADLLDAVSSESDPLILAGDFNLTNESRLGRELAAAGLRDSFDLGGRGRGSIWPVNGLLRYVTGVRIDHIYVGGGLTCADARTGIGQGSDHRPVVVVVGFER